MPLQSQGLLRSFSAKLAEKIHHGLKAFFGLFAGDKLGDSDDCAEKGGDCAKPSEDVRALNQIDDGFHTLNKLSIGLSIKAIGKSDPPKK